MVPGAVATSCLFLARKSEMSKSLTSVASLLFDLEVLDAADVLVSQKDPVIHYPLGRFCRGEPHSYRCVRSKLLFRPFQPCDLVDLESLGEEVIVLHQLLNALLGIFRER
jgi:hypothetical protein